LGQDDEGGVMRSENSVERRLVTFFQAVE